MKSLRASAPAVFALFISLSLAVASVAEARVGGGKSSGFRGSRGFGTRSSQTAPYNSQSNYQQTAPAAPAGGAFGNNSGMASGGFMRGLMGGLAGGMIGSMLFRNSSFAGGTGGTGGGIGLLEIMLLLGLGFMAYRYLAGRKQSMASGMTPYEKLRSVEPGPFAPNTSPSSASASGEPAYAATLSRYDMNFDLTAFKDERMDDFMRLQAAWNFRDLSSISNRVGPELMQQLDNDVNQLKTAGQINRIEQIAVRGTELIEAWQEYGKEFATLRFRANLVDYTVEEVTGRVVSGDRSHSVKFEEDWTFVRAVDAPAASNPWKLTSIEA